MNGEKQPILVLSEDSERQKGRDAQTNNISAAKSLADTVKATLGPKGMDKMLVDSIGDVTITNDGVTMLKEMDIEHPAAKMVVEVAESQDEECGDGTTSAVVLAGALLKKAENMIESGIHPTTITRGYRLASNKAIEVLEEIKTEVDPNKKETLKRIAETAMTGKAIEMDKESLAEISVDATSRIVTETDGKKEVDVDNIKIVKKAGASVLETELVEGLILEKERVHEGMPNDIDDARIALLNSAIEVKETETDAEIKITDTEQMQNFIEEEEKTLQEMVKKIKKVGANVVLCQKGIDDLAQHYMAKEGIFAIRRVKKSDMKKLVKATGANIVTSIEDLDPVDLGRVKMVSEKNIGDSRMTFVENGDRGKAVTLLLRGGSEHVVDELERALNDALKVVAITIMDGYIVPGGGAPEIELHTRMQDFASTIEGREQMAVKAFSEAMTEIPKTLAQNAGMDGMNVLMQLRALHEKDGLKNHGINIENEEFEDMLENGVVEPLRIKTQAISSASELSEMILMIDDIIAAKGDHGEGAPEGAPQPGGGMGGMPPGMM